MRQPRRYCKSGRLKIGPCTEAFLDQQFRCFIKALTALRLLAKTGINGIGIAAAPARCSPQVGFPDGIADADIHRRLRSSLNLHNANRSQ